LDFAGMMLFTAAALHTRTWPMANGANLAYTKEFFQTVGGFNNNHTYASGDDVFLMQQAFLHRPEQILFLKSNQAVVHTHTVSNWSDFIQQRIRWGTKNRRFSSPNSLFITAAVFLTSLFIVLSFLLIPFQPLYFPGLFIGLFVVKMISDYWLLKAAVTHFGKASLLHQFFLSEVIHTLYIAFIGLAALLVKNYRWKGRQVK
jgi:biofilm PGA synthesis N-glycosyltransferase PgaC